MAIGHQEKCTKSHAQTAELKQKCHSNRMANDPFTVEIVIGSVSQEEITIEDN